MEEGEIRDDKPESIEETSSSEEGEIDDLKDAPSYCVAKTLEQLLTEPEVEDSSMDPAFPLEPKKVPIAFKWKYVSNKYLQKPAPRVQPACYICNKSILLASEAPEASTTDPQVTTVSKDLPRELGVCDECEKVNRTNREYVTDLSGKTALVTGGRIKIGYEVALKLIRCGATVIVVTRFPRDAARKFLLESDSSLWRDRLHIYGVDLRHLGMVSSFISHVKEHYCRLDILINNAAQTVRRPPAYYYSLCKKEMANGEEDSRINDVMKKVGCNPWDVDPEELPDSSNNLLEIEAAIKSFALVSASTSKVPSKALVAQINKFLYVAPSAVLTQLPLVSTDALKDKESFPPNQLDIYGEQLDLRKNTSWVQKVGEVEPVEAAEVQLVNSVVPFMFVSQLTDMLSKISDPAFIVNVSSPEGQFSNTKTGEHVHTNMAKAALNMMTLTVASDLALKNIHVTSVDTGWVSRMRPGQPQSNSCLPPLSCADGSARVLHPIFHGLQTGKPLSGVFLRNFAVTAW